VRHPGAHSGRFHHPAPLFALLAVTAATLFGSAGPASAGTGYGQLIVNPGTASPGQTVSILGVCPTNGSTLAGVRSSAFVGGSASVTLGPENFSGTATIASSAMPGSYTVTAECGSGSPSVNITVSAAVGKPTTAPPTTAPAQPSPTPTHSSAPLTSSAAAPMPVLPTAGTPTPTPSVGRTSPSPGMPSAPASSMAAAAPGTTAAPAVTSTGVIRVGLAGQSSPLSTTFTAVLVAAACLVACAVGFLLHRRRRNSAVSHD